MPANDSTLTNLWFALPGPAAIALESACIKSLLHPVGMSSIARAPLCCCKTKLQVKSHLFIIASSGRELAELHMRACTPGKQARPVQRIAGLLVGLNLARHGCQCGCAVVQARPVEQHPADIMYGRFIFSFYFLNLVVMVDFAACELNHHDS